MFGSPWVAYGVRRDWKYLQPPGLALSSATDPGKSIIWDYAWIPDKLSILEIVYSQANNLETAPILFWPSQRMTLTQHYRDW